MMRRLLPALLFLLPCAVEAQFASYTYISQKAPYKNARPPWFYAANLPGIGTMFRMGLPYSWRKSNGTGAVYVLATGLTNPSVHIPALGGYLFSSAEVIFVTQRN